MDETINRNFNIDPDSFEVPRHSSIDRTNRLVYRTNEIKPAANLEEIQKQNNFNQFINKEKENDSNKLRQANNFNRQSPTSKEGSNNNIGVNDNLKEKDKEKKPYYGKTLVIVILVLIILEYYAYVLNRLENSKGNKYHYIIHIHLSYSI